LPAAVVVQGLLVRLDYDAAAPAVDDQGVAVIYLGPDVPGPDHGRQFQGLGHDGRVGSAAAPFRDQAGQFRLGFGDFHEFGRAYVPDDQDGAGRNPGQAAGLVPQEGRDKGVGQHLHIGQAGAYVFVRHRVHEPGYLFNGPQDRLLGVDPLHPDKAPGLARQEGIIQEQDMGADYAGLAVKFRGEAGAGGPEAGPDLVPGLVQAPYFRLHQFRVGEPVVGQPHTGAA